MRQSAYLRRRYRAVFACTGLILALCGAWMLAPLLALAAWPEEAVHLPAFSIPAVILIAGGLAAWRGLRDAEVELDLAEGGVVVLLAWLGAALASAVPLACVEGLSATQAVFESVSGWTTTGLSVVDVTRAAHVTLLWRSLMQLAGGAGFAILMLAALAGPGPALGAAEGRAEQLVPNVRQSARLVLRIYAAYVALGLFAYRAAGMGWFDATNHAFAALSTGGFSTRVDSIGAFDSPAVEAVTIVLMLLGSTSFLTSWLLWRGRLRAALASGELRLVALLVPLGVGALALFALPPLYPALGERWRIALFETLTALTTTGFSTVGYGEWSGLGLLVLIAAMLVGGGAFSTAGGIKQFRVHALWRGLVRELARPFRPRGVVLDESVPAGEGRMALDDAALRAVGVYVFLYLGVWILGAAVLAAHGATLQEALFEYASALGTVGLSLGVTRADAAPLVLWTETVGMLLGRLEFVVVLVSAAKLARDAAWMVRREGEGAAARPRRGASGSRVC